MRLANRILIILIFLPSPGFAKADAAGAALANPPSSRVPT